MPLLRRRSFSSLARALLVASFALAAPGFASALYDRDSAVSSLNAGNWNQMVRQDKDVFWLVEFYAPYCGHCKKLAPEYEAAAKEVRSLYSGAIKAKLGAVDCVENERLCAEYDVRGYPAIKAFPAGAERKKNRSPTTAPGTPPASSRSSARRWRAAAPAAPTTRSRPGSGTSTRTSS